MNSTETHDGAAAARPVSNKFGAFGGVFTPSILTILGVIMFMRTGYVTGQAGIMQAMLILLAAKTITFLTGLSISALATNTEVKGGGAYFLISRSLGPEFGGAIGLALFMAQALSVPFYILGFTEAMTASYPQMSGDFLLVGLATATALFVVNYVGASWAIKTQYFILAVLALSVVSFLGGAILDFDPATFRENLKPAYVGPEVNFWVIFAVFFPAVTGIMAGVNMSGDLEDPPRAIPRGTLAATAVGALVYGAQIVLTGGAIGRQRLIDAPYQSLLNLALFDLDFIVMSGVYAATLSSAIGSLMGAPRILQAVARDDIFTPLRFFAQGTPQGDEPRRGLWLTFGMTVGVLFFAGNDAGGGALNAVAVVLTMFFLFTYGMTNLALFVEQISRNPSFRPRFTYFHWGTALLGAAGCIGAAILINPMAALVAAAILVGLYFYVSRRILETAFGDARRGFYYERVRQNLQKLASQPVHAKNWRPTTLVLSGNAETRLTLTKYASWLENRRGIVTLAHVLVGDFHANVERRAEAQRTLQEVIEAHDLRAFAEVVVAADFDEGLSALLQAHSVGPIKPNLVMFGWPSQTSSAERFAYHMRLAAELGKSQVLVVDRGLPEVGARSRRIDIWWRGRKNGSLMVILGYLLASNVAWRGARLRILRVVESDEDAAEAAAEIDRIIEAARINAEPVIVDDGDPTEAIVANSADADVVLLGFEPPTAGEAAAFHASYASLVEELPTTLIVSSSGDADLLS